MPDEADEPNTDAQFLTEFSYCSRFVVFSGFNPSSGEADFQGRGRDGGGATNEQPSSIGAPTAHNRTVNAAVSMGWSIHPLILSHHARSSRLARMPCVTLKVFHRDAVACRRFGAWWCGVLLLWAVIAGCADTHGLDREAAALIERRQALSLGEDAPNDPRRVPTTPHVARPSDSDYRLPPTNNPSVNELPARTDPTPGREPGDEHLVDPPMPKMLDSEGEAMAMTLEQILAYAIENSREYRDRKEDLFIASLNLLIERHLWGPRFFNETTARFSGTPERGDHDQAFSLLNDFRITQRLPYGGEVSIGALVNFVNMLQNASGRTSPTQDTAITFDAVIPLLRGAGMVAREDLIQAERDLVYAARSFERFRREFFVNIAIDYYNLIAQQDQIQNLKRQVEGLEHLARRFEALARAGRSPFFEAEQAAANVLFARNNLSNAEENYAGALDAFKLRIGMPMTQQLVIVPSEVVVPEPLLDTVEAVQTAYQYRLDLQTAADLIDDARRRVAVARNRLLPDLDLFANTTIPTDRQRDIGGLDLSLDDASYSAGVRFGAPLDRRIETIQYRQALIAYDRTQRSFTLERDRVAQQVRSAIRRIRQARFTLELQERNVHLATRRLQGVLLDVRGQSPREVIEAEEDLLEARNRRDAAVRDLRVSVLQFLLQTGQMRVAPTGQWLAPAQLVPLPNKAAAPNEGQPDEDRNELPPAEPEPSEGPVNLAPEPAGQ